jgi:hypothetical protein
MLTMTRSMPMELVVCHVVDGGAQCRLRCALDGEDLDADRGATRNARSLASLAPV